MAIDLGGSEHSRSRMLRAQSVKNLGDHPGPGNSSSTTAVGCQLHARVDHCRANIFVLRFFSTLACGKVPRADVGVEFPGPQWSAKSFADSAKNFLGSFRMTSQISLTCEVEFPSILCEADNSAQRFFQSLACGSAPRADVRVAFPRPKWSAKSSADSAKKILGSFRMKSQISLASEVLFQSIFCEAENSALGFFQSLACGKAPGDDVGVEFPGPQWSPKSSADSATKIL